jgi:MarR family transcriptional regulator, organic hydroperoxide resistance regulator
MKAVTHDKPFDLEVSRAILRRWHEDVPNDRLAHLVKDAERVFRRALSMRLAPHGVPFGYWTFLRVLWERDGITQRELAIGAGVSEPAALAALRAMEASGYLTRRRRVGNRKNGYIALTPAGKGLKRKLVPLAVGVNAIATRGVPPADIAATRRCLLAILDNLARDEVAMTPEPEKVRRVAVKRRATKGGRWTTAGPGPAGARRKR